MIMKYVNEYYNGELAKRVAGEIAKLSGDQHNSGEGNPLQTVHRSRQVEHLML